MMVVLLVAAYATLSVPAYLVFTGKLTIATTR